MALAYSNIDVELREILLKDRPIELYNISPKGTVPVLQTKNSIIDESLDIMLWALNIQDTDKWSIDLDAQLSKISLNDREFKYWLDRYKYHDRYPDNTKDYYWEKCFRFLSDLDSSANKNNGYLFANHLTLTDISIFPFVRQCANVDISKFDNLIYLKPWLDNMISSNLFYSVMSKYAVWGSNNEPLIINFRNHAKKRLS